MATETTSTNPTSFEVTRPDKLLWPEIGITKHRYASYLDTVAYRTLPWLRDRPLTLVRAPDGVGGKRYFQKAVPSYAPSWIRRIRIAAPSAGRDVDHVVCDGTATLAWLGNQAAVELHPAPVRTDRLDRSDLLVVDIDPPEGAFDAAVDAAILTLEVIECFGLPFGVKTTGGKGLHIVVPIERRLPQAALRSAAARLTAMVVGRRPDLFTDEFRKMDRRGRVLLDPSRNGTGATIVAPYPPRARSDGTVSFPVSSDRLEEIRPEDYTLITVLTRLDEAGPRRWQALQHERGRIPAALHG